MSTISLAPKKLNMETARSFLRDVTNENDVFHVFFGRTLPWNSGAESIPTPADTRLVDAETHLSISAIKRVQESDVIYLVPKVLWTSGSVYDRYDDDVDLGSLVGADGKPTFYVFNENNNCIYKCLNRQDYIDGNEGVVFPDTPVPTPSVTPTISVSKSVQISPTPTPSYGSSSSVTPSLTIIPSITPSLTVSHTVSPSVTPTHTISPTVTPTHTVSASFGASPTPTPTATPSMVVSTSPNEGDIYALGNLTWVYDGSDWQLVSTVEPSDISGVEKFQTADGYWWKMVYYVPNSDFEKFVDTNNTSTYLPVRFFPSTTSFNTGGYLNSISVKNTGNGYKLAPSVIITGDGKGAYAEARVNVYGEVVGVDVLHGGHGYTFATITLEPKIDENGNGLGSGATATSRLLGTQPPGQTLNVELAAMAQATAGSIEFVDIQNIPQGRGSNYNTETSFQVVGDGVGAVVDVILNGDGGIDVIIVTNPGTGYTFASILPIGAGNGAELKPIISPIFGHGGNVPAELLSTTIGVVVDVQSSLPDFFLGNDFRQIGIIKNVRAYSNMNIPTAIIGDSSYILSVSDKSKYSVGHVITTNDGGKFEVIETAGNLSDLPHNTVRLSPIIDIITEESVLTNSTTGQTLAAAGIIKRNESRNETAEMFSDSTGDASCKINVLDIANYAVDDIILTDDGGKFVVIEKNPNGVANSVRLLPIIDRISINSVLTNYTTSPTADIFTGNLASLNEIGILPATRRVITLPEIDKKSGDIIYIKNTAPYIRQLNQTETVKLYLQF